MRMHRWYTAEEIQFVKKTIRGRTYVETLKLFNKRFGLRISLKQLETLTYKHKIYNSVGKWLPGHVPWSKGRKHKSQQGNYKPIGSERMQQGYVWVKVSSGKYKGNKNWKGKHVAIWEKANGKVPKNHLVIFADGNRRNFALDNLLLVSRAVHGLMNVGHFRTANKNLTEVGKLAAELSILIVKRKRRSIKSSKKKKLIFVNRKGTKYYVLRDPVTKKWMSFCDTRRRTQRSWAIDLPPR